MRRSLRKLVFGERDLTGLNVSRGVSVFGAKRLGGVPAVIPTITGSPSIANQVESETNNAVTPAPVAGSPAPEVTYQFQESSDNGATWSDLGPEFGSPLFQPEYALVRPNEISLRIKQIARNSAGEAVAFSNGAEVILDLVDLAPVLHFEPRRSTSWIERSGQVTTTVDGDPVGEVENLGTGLTNRFAVADNNRPLLTNGGTVFNFDIDDWHTLGRRLTEIEGQPEASHCFVGRTKVTSGTRILFGQGSGSADYSMLGMFSENRIFFYASTPTDSNFLSVNIPDPTQREKYFFEASVGGATKTRRTYVSDFITPAGSQTVSGAGASLVVSNTAWHYGIRPTQVGFLSQPDEELNATWARTLTATERGQLARYIEYYYGL